MTSLIQRPYTSNTHTQSENGDLGMKMPKVVHEIPPEPESEVQKQPSDSKGQKLHSCEVNYICQVAINTTVA